MNSSKAAGGAPSVALFFVNEFLPAVCMAVTGICITGVTFTLCEGEIKLPS